MTTSLTWQVALRRSGGRSRAHAFLAVEAAGVTTVQPVPLCEWGGRPKAGIRVLAPATPEEITTNRCGGCDTNCASAERGLHESQLRGHPEPHRRRAGERRERGVTHEPLRIQAYLRDGGGLDYLLATYGIKAKRHGKHPNLVLFKYDQIASPFAEPIVRECRGIILDESDGWRVVARAFDKFFNHGEGHAAALDWSTARVQEKVDGSLALLYRYAGEWHVATTGTPDASGDVNGMGITFADLFWRNFTVPLPTEPDVCFYFELTGPLNRIVVRHEREGLTLLGARSMRTQRELSLEMAAAILPGIPAVREFSLRNFEAIAATFEAMSPLAQEGYVVVDGTFNRVKVKHPGYVALHHAKGGLSRKAFVEIARSGECSEVVVAFPEFAPMLDEAASRYDALAHEVEADYERLKDIPEQKAFALQAVTTKCSGALFAVRAKKAESVRAFLRSMQINSLMALLGYKRGEDEAPVAAMEAA